MGPGDSDENGNSGCDVSAADTTGNSLTHGGGIEETAVGGGEGGGGSNKVSSSLLVTTNVSFDENHKRNSVHLFVADVNENEHINEAEETTRV